MMLLIATCKPTVMVDTVQVHAEASWIYIVFDHNEHELETARARAEQLTLGLQPAQACEEASMTGLQK